MSSAPVEMRWQVHGLGYAGLAWGDPQNRPLLALHGWLDNAASFALLAPVLAEHWYVVALDLSGHGKSDWRSPDATYQIYDDLPQILGVIDQLGWQQFDLIGHSRGALIAALLAAAFPERVSHLVLLDAVAPSPLAPEEFSAQLRRFVLDKQRLLQRATRVYTSEADAVQTRVQAGLKPEAAALLVSRNLRQCDGGLTWRTDPRLRGASAVKLTVEQVETMLSSLHMPTLVVAGDDGLGAAHPDHFASLVERMPNAVLEFVPGGHHFHMEDAIITLAKKIRRLVADSA
ncbi:alpha/beta hydrolase [Pseudohalioglobus sediminis]|uniref:Alpha/beta hydrolase n=1 Tax=Pseudohalioglobus sediminis TaxID=2606449 RepID=A0A5B0WPJ3_9GAMM|nr:alpha/beta fold hydrolase [Pseudohalioglobus sediminis]KAA1188121.1 alpha/beta hydrolase [Pseudohalioglobus sediminis]